jgi:hypothetical protein
MKYKQTEVLTEIARAIQESGPSRGKDGIKKLKEK